MRLNLAFMALTIAAVLLLVGQRADGANCALRNPDRQIYELFPDATSYRTIVANVDEKCKPAIESFLGSAVSFNDLAKHTVYVILKKDVPIGFIHPRAEIGKHGSVELVWALDLDLRIRDFRVQRSREKHTSAIESDVFRTALLGLDYLGLRGFLSDSNTRVDAVRLGAPTEAESIVHTTILCGAKTLIITRVAFVEQLSPLRLLGNAYRFFPATFKVTRLTSPLGEPSINRVRELLGAAPTQLSAGGVDVVRSLDESGRPLGAVVSCDCAYAPHGAQFWWAVSAEGAVQELVLLGASDESSAATTASLKGKSLSDLRDSGGAQPSSALRTCAEEVLAMLSAQGAAR